MKEKKPTKLDVENSVKTIEDYYKGKVINADYDVRETDGYISKKYADIVIDGCFSFEIRLIHGVEEIYFSGLEPITLRLSKTVTLKLSFSESEKKQAYDNFMLKHNS